MSSFMVEDRTINEIVYYVFDNELDALFGIKMPRQKFAEALKKINADAIETKYREHPDTGIKYEPAVATKMQVYKDIRCLLYQCMEGKVPMQKTYKLLEKIGRYIAERIVENLPEYYKAQWR